MDDIVREIVKICKKKPDAFTGQAEFNHLMADIVTILKIVIHFVKRTK
jgi:hypothetical protein